MCSRRGRRCGCVVGGVGGVGVVGGVGGVVSVGGSRVCVGRGHVALKSLEWTCWAVLSFTLNECRKGWSSRSGYLCSGAPWTA